MRNNVNMMHTLDARQEHSHDKFLRKSPRSIPLNRYITSKCVNACFVRKDHSIAKAIASNNTSPEVVANEHVKLHLRPYISTRRKEALPGMLVFGLSPTSAKSRNATLKRRATIENRVVVTLLNKGLSENKTCTTNTDLTSEDEASLPPVLKTIATPRKVVISIPIQRNLTLISSTMKL